MTTNVKPEAQHPQAKPWYDSLFQWVAGDTRESMQHKVKASMLAAGSNALGQMLASDKAAEGVKTLSEKTLFVHPVTSVNTLYASLKQVASSETLQLADFQGLQVQFATFITSEESDKLDIEQLAVLSEMSTRLTKARKELTGQSPTEQAAGLATIKGELPGMVKRIGSLVEVKSLVGRVATTFWNVIISKAKQVAPFLFVERAPPTRIKIDESPVTPDLNWVIETKVEAFRLASNGSACLTLRLICETFCGIEYDMNDYRTILAQGKDRLKRSTLAFLKQKKVSCLRYFFVWCFFSLGYWLIHRYVERATQAYLKEARSFIKTQKEHKYERLINTTLEEGSAFYYAINAKLRRQSNLINEQFQKELELPDSEAIYEKIGNDLFKKARINWIVALLIKWFIASPKEIAKKATTSFAESLHKNQQYGLNQILLGLLKQAEDFQREHPEPLPHKDHPLKRMELVSGYVRNFVDAALLSSCKTPDQIVSGVQNRSFPNDPIGQFLDALPQEVMTQEQRNQIRIQSHEELMRGAIAGFADIIEKTVQEKSLQKSLYETLVSANAFFLPVNAEEARTPEQLDTAVRERTVNLMNDVIAKKLGLPEEATPYLSRVTTPYANGCLTLISNSLQPAIFQRMLAIYLKSP